MKTELVKYEKADGAYYRIKHPSGLTIFYYPLPGKSKSAAMIATKFGSNNRSFRKSGSDEWVTVPDGIAHFLEHKLFEGPEGSAFDFYAKTGAKANAYTSNDRTAYYFVTADHFYESLEILIRFVKNPYFTAENVEKEKGIIGQEIKMYEDDSVWCGYLALTKALYKEHPVRVDIAGTTQTISKITDTMLYDCYGTFYNNSNLSLFIAGDLDMDKILSVCDKMLPIEEKVRIEQSFPQEAAEVFQSRVEISMDISRPQFFIGIKDPDVDPLTPRHEICVKLLVDCLFGESSNFYKELYRSGLINAEFSAGYECGVGYGFVLCNGESDAPDKVFDKVEEIVSGFSESSIDEKTFLRLRNAYYGDMLRGLDGAGTLNNRFLQYRLLDGDVFSPLRALEEITTAEIIQTGRALLRKDRMALSVVNTKGE